VLTAINKPNNSIWIKASSQEELGNTFIRFQEYYESPNPKFRKNIFTLGQVRNYYSMQSGGDTYQKDWVGFNFPSYVLEPFRQGLFDPLTEEEKELINLLKYRYDKFYLIGAQDEKVLRHELAHALYANNIEYQTKINNLLNKEHKKIVKVYKRMLKLGYYKEFVYDEIQAYVTDNDNAFIKANLDSKIITTINELYNQYNEKSKT
jgi:hypothetical protein